jgi:tetratricopeptide (TPR) repeat protein
VPRRVNLARAERLLRARKYAQVIGALEPQVFLYRDNPDFYRVLGFACLYAGDYSGAGSYLRRTDQIRSGEIGVLLGLAVVHLRRRELSDALRCWLSVLDQQPGNRTAKRGLSLVRSTPDPVDFVAMAESGRLRRLFPPLPVYFPRWLWIALGTAVLVAAAAIFVPGIVRDWSAARAEPRTGFDSLELDGLQQDLVDDAESFVYQLTPEEIEVSVARIGDYFNDYQDNLAAREANRILNSNASPLVKERVRQIATYFREPTFADGSYDYFSYDDVIADPLLYEGCYVRWRGQTSNAVQTADGGVQFTLLVGYENQQVLEGVIDARSRLSFDFSRGPVEVIGQVTYDGSSLVLDVTSAHRIRAAAEE